MPENKAAHFPVKWLITIVDRGRGEMAAELLNQVHKSVHMISLGKGTASSEIMDYLGLDEPEKDIVMSLIPQPLEKKLLQVLCILFDIFICKLCGSCLRRPRKPVCARQG